MGHYLWLCGEINGKKVLFITGTDTDVGKTEVAAGLVELANQKGLRTGAIKPVAAGCEDHGDGPQNDDALKLQSLASVELSYQQVNPIALDLPMAPHGGTGTGQSAVCE